MTIDPTQTLQRMRRDEPDREPSAGNIKVTRSDWLNAAMDVLITNGVGEVKVLAISDRLGVSRSSFYWYFDSRQDLLDALLKFWEATNTAALVVESESVAKTITQAVCNVFRCFVDPDRFDNALDFAIRDWARRSAKVRKIMVQSDQTRISALQKMFERFGYGGQEALTRARTLYFMQMGYNIAELNETMEDRLKLIPDYLVCFTGKAGSAEEIENFSNYCRLIQQRNSS
jgi:AcrR family transcriptional regulator